MAFALAGMLAMSNLNVMNTSAAGETTYPTYDASTGKYVFGESEIFGAATRVHLFGNYVSTTGHTHGNIMAEEAVMEETGMRYGNTTGTSGYVEYSYVGDSISMGTYSMHSSLILGADIGYDSNTMMATNKNGSTAKISLAVVNGEVKSSVIKSPVDAVDIKGTLDKLKTLSKEWANSTNTNVTPVDESNQSSNRSIYTKQIDAKNENIYINIPVANWVGKQDPIKIRNMDKDPSNTGIVIINLDMNGVQDATIQSQIKVYESDPTQGEYMNPASEHTTTDFGKCRLVYNIIDSSKDDRIYTGKITFSNSILVQYLHGCRSTCRAD